MMKKIGILLSSIWLTFAQQDQHVWEGNLALKAAQQPNPFFSFGQNVNDPGDTIGILYTDWIRGCNQQSIDVVPGLIYQSHKNFSWYVVAPVAASSVDGVNNASMANVFIQGEYSWFSKTTQHYTAQSTLVGNITFPTGEEGQGFFTGAGSPSFFIGTTSEYVTPSWYAFYSIGAILPVWQGKEKPGNNFLYQAGICGNIAYKPKQWLLSALVEFFGIYAQRDTICGAQDPNSGGNTFYIGPSLWYARQQFVAQAAIAFPVVQQLHGIQRKRSCWIGFEVRWTFNG